MTDLKKVYSIHFKQIHSTNVWAKEHASSLAPNHITYITADSQTAGKGRFGKPWISPKGNVYSSLFFSIPKGAPYLSNISQLLSYSAAIVLKKLGFSPQIKWPNDLQLEGKKVAGVLTETVDLKNGLGVVVGIGLNVNMSADSLENVDQPATSLAMISGKEWNVDEIMAAILEDFRHSLLILEKEGFAPFQADYEAHLAYKGQSVQCQKGTTLLEGICHSITREGNLNLLLPSGEMASIGSGEIQQFRKKA